MLRRVSPAASDAATWTSLQGYMVY
ncbi:hypothetical protein FRAAL4874 [Frankia alni ACN14a]|uniref:Uncharacterized protein n=1 Tax=Frankia alni (strain DSM 45986 / CECT 9034 / ACN14a) TaxID=326424 RepID=Q0RG74_FRAAA|nr:hypothetical protein FRAAL4874 [Frankia alni ACN14a]